MFVRQSTTTIQVHTMSRRMLSQEHTITGSKTS
jgi:hypothetical protein